MNGVWSNQDIMKVAPNPDLIKSGYLFAYLCSRFGVPLITSGTYGAIIQHIEPEHIADLPVPRLGPVEDQAHELVQQAADLRTKASESLVDAIAMMERESGLQRIPAIANSGIGFGARAVSSTVLVKRMDASFHSPFHEDALCSIRAIAVGTSSVQDIAESIFEPKRFKRIQVDDEEFGVPLFGTTALMWADPQPSFLIPKRLASEYALVVDERTVLIPRSGQVAGIIGSAVLPYGKLIGGAVSEDAIRIRCHSAIDAGYLFVVLNSEYGKRQLKARTYGSSIPHLDVDQIANVLIPKLDSDLRRRIGSVGFEISELRSKAVSLEHSARYLVESAIEEIGR
jgi:type I restriction enzyme S subunit